MATGPLLPLTRADNAHGGKGSEQKKVIEQANKHKKRDGERGKEAKDAECAVKDAETR